jgi:hypothetical protein
MRRQQSLALFRDILRAARRWFLSPHPGAAARWLYCSCAPLPAARLPAGIPDRRDRADLVGQARDRFRRHVAETDPVRSSSVEHGDAEVPGRRRSPVLPLAARDCGPGGARPRRARWLQAHAPFGGRAVAEARRQRRAGNPLVSTQPPCLTNLLLLL